MRYKMKSAFAVALYVCFSSSACVSSREDAVVPPGSFQMDEGSGFEFVWERCAIKDGRGCINGSFRDVAYSLGFTEDGKRLAGNMGTERVEFILDESDVGALGRDVYELKYLTKDGGLLATVTWNANKNKVIGHAIVPTD